MAAATDKELKEIIQEHTLGGEQPRSVLFRLAHSVRALRLALTAEGRAESGVLTAEVAALQAQVGTLQAQADALRAELREAVCAESLDDLAGNG